MSPSWNTYSFDVGMPHTLPGAKLSEVELMKLLAVYQWDAIARLLDRRPSEITNDLKERLYASVSEVEFDLGSHSLDSLGEDKRVSVRNRVGLFGERFAEGLFVLDDREIPDDGLAKLSTRSDLLSQRLPWAYFTNAFVARGGSNTSLRIFRPSGLDQVDSFELAEEPEGLSERKQVEATGEIPDVWSSTPPTPLQLGPAGNPDGPCVVTYEITPESDLNGAGLVYFARYVAMMNYGLRRALTEVFEPPLSATLVAHLSTRRRKIYYFGNASPSDSVRISTSVGLLGEGQFESHPPSGRYRQPLELIVRSDLRRVSDKVLMASSLAQQSLNVPASERAVLAEAKRLLRSLSAAS